MDLSTEGQCEVSGVADSWERGSALSEYQRFHGGSWSPAQSESLEVGGGNSSGGASRIKTQLVARMW